MDLQQSSYFRNQLAKHIEGGEAFMPIEEILFKIPYEKTGIVPEGLPYSLWQLVYHIRFAQQDILDYSRNSDYKAAKWPDDYWPSSSKAAGEEEWNHTVAAYFQERREFIDLVQDFETDLFEPFPHGEGQTLFREALLVVEHNAYHTGQILVLLRVLGIYK